MAEASTDEQKLSPAEKAKLAAAKKAEAAKKAGPVGDPLVDNEDGTITDPNSGLTWNCLLYTSPSPRDATLSRMPSSA